MHIGIEVEGRLKGLRTLFLSTKELEKGNSKAIDSVLYEENQIVQIYVSALGEYSEIKNIDVGYLAYLSNIYVLTIELDNLRAFNKLKSEEQVDFQANLIYTLEAPEIWDLSKTDQIKFVSNQHVMTFTLETAMETMPVDFLNDVEVV